MRGMRGGAVGIGSDEINWWLFLSACVISEKELDGWQQEKDAADAEICKCICVRGEESVRGDRALIDAFDSRSTVKLQEKLYAPLNEKRDAIVSKVDGFWKQALTNCEPIASFFDDEDWQVLAHIKDIKVKRPADDPRACTITFTFNDNDFLAENTLTKEFKVSKDAGPIGSEDFDWEHDLVPSKTEVKWKSDEVSNAKGMGRSAAIQFGANAVPAFAFVAALRR